MKKMFLFSLVVVIGVMANNSLASAKTVMGNEYNVQRYDPIKGALIPTPVYGIFISDGDDAYVLCSDALWNDAGIFWYHRYDTARDVHDGSVHHWYQKDQYHFLLITYRADNSVYFTFTNTLIGKEFLYISRRAPARSSRVTV